MVEETLQRSLEVRTWSIIGGGLSEPTGGLRGCGQRGHGQREWWQQQPGGHGRPGTPVQLAVRGAAAERDVPSPSSPPPDLLALHGCTADARLASWTLRNSGAAQLTEPRRSPASGTSRPQRRSAGGSVRKSRVRELRLHPDAAVATRWYRPLPVQCVRPLQQDERPQSAPHQAAEARALIAAARTVLCQLSHHNHHLVAQKRRRRTCVQCLRTLHEAPWGASTTCYEKRRNSNQETKT